jgi:hypothetical protein
MKSNNKNRACSLAVLYVLALSLAAGAAKVEVRWSQLSSLVLGHTVTLVLPGGTSIAGDVVAVRDDALALDIRKTSDSKVQPKGTASIPRASVTTLQITDTKGPGGRILGVVVGVVVGMVAGGEIVAHSSTSEAGAVATFTGVAVAGAVGGYFGGRSVDTKTTIIRIVAE